MAFRAGELGGGALVVQGLKHRVRVWECTQGLRGWSLFQTGLCDLRPSGVPESLELMQSRAT